MKKIAYIILSLSPVLTFAQGETSGSFNVGYFQGILNFAKTVIRDGIPILFGLAVIFFFWSIIQFIRTAADKPADASKAKGGIIWGAIAIAVMASIWGIVAFLGGIFGVNTSAGGTIVPPSVQGL